MTNFNRHDESDQIRFFHACTDGENNGVVFFGSEDYIQATLIATILAEKHSVRIICFCHMTTHSHFVIWCNSAEDARLFIEGFKRDYSRHLAHRHDISASFRRTGTCTSEINDIIYLKNCISYVLLNPVAAGIVRSPEEYQWSSFNAYFTQAEAKGRPVKAMSTREMVRCFKSKCNMKDSGLLIETSGMPSLKSFVDYRLVERLFGGPSAFFKSLALTNYATEEARYVPHVARYDDNELNAEANMIARNRFNQASFVMLTKVQKFQTISILMKKTGVSAKRLARILRLGQKEVSSFFGSGGEQ